MVEKYDFSNEGMLNFYQKIHEEKENLINRILLSGSEDENDACKSSYKQILDEEKEYEKKRKSYVEEFQRYVGLREDLLKRIKKPAINFQEKLAIDTLKAILREEERSLLKKNIVSYKKDIIDFNKWAKYIEGFRHGI